MNDERIEESIECPKERRKERLIERLQEEKAIVKGKEKGEWKALGIIHGKREAYEFSYSRFKKVEIFQKSIRGKDGKFNKEPTELLKKFKKEIDEREKQLNSLAKEYKNFKPVGYIIGWLKSVAEIWKEIRYELGEEDY